MSYLEKLKIKPVPEKQTEFQIKINIAENDEANKESAHVEKPNKIKVTDIRKESKIDRDFILSRLQKKTNGKQPIILGETFHSFEKQLPKKIEERIIIENDEPNKEDSYEKDNEEFFEQKDSIIILDKKNVSDTDIDIEDINTKPPITESIIKLPIAAVKGPIIKIKKVKKTEKTKLDNGETKEKNKLDNGETKPEKNKIVDKETTKNTDTQLVPAEFSKRAPKPNKFVIRVSDYYMNNRKLFIENMIELFKPYKTELLKDDQNVSCEKRSENENVELMTHQKVVRDYLNLYTPYRGLLLYHGLGAGKTNASIAIAEGMKSKKQIILMTPASLKANFFVELKKYGDPLFRKNQFWEKVSVEGRPEYVDILSQLLSLSKDFIIKEKGAWLFNANEPANFKNLSKEDQTAVDNQLDKMIRAKYIDINYNGLNRRIVDELTRNSTINPFDHKVLIIDEAHNFVSMIVNQIRSPKSIMFQLYELILKATDCRIVLLSGTPIINYPNEIGVLYNILRGHIKTWSFPLTVKTEQKITRDTILNMFEKANFKTYDYVEYSGNVLKITRNPFGFINDVKNGNVKQKGGLHDAMKNSSGIIGGFMDSVFGKENVLGGKKHNKTNKNKKTNKTNKNDNTRKIERLENPYKIKDGIVILEKEIQSTDDLKSDELINEGIPTNYYEGGNTVFQDYNGVRLDERGNISDTDFIKKVKKILADNGLEVQRMHTDHFKALPDKSDAFMNTFIDPNEIVLKNENLFKKRILGLTSYFRSAQEKLLPTIIKSEDGLNYTLVRCEMSEYQFGIYAEIRKKEYESEKQSKKQKKKQNNSDELYQVASSYRIFSRACCNFAFPTPPGRPMPNKRKVNDANGANEANGANDANVNKETIDENDLDDIETDPDTGSEEKSESKEYEKRIQAALKFISTPSSDSEEEGGENYLSSNGLRKYSPKFLKVLEHIKDPENVGLHLLYSQFRSIEGIGILKLVLDENGFSQFKVKRNATNNEWELDIEEENQGKPKYVLYTGTESKEEKAVLLNIYNNNWYEENISENLRKQLETISRNNFYGEIIKVFMITSSGAEGINLKNTRFVHIVEPYWHLVRTEQVIGRARRICSHSDLPDDLKTVKVFLYLSVFSQQQKTDKQNIELMIRDLSRIDKRPITTDESLYDISLIKNTVNQQILKAMKESAMDCRLYSKTNKDEKLVCYGFGKIESNDYASYPSLEQDENAKEEINVETKLSGLVETKPINGIKYALDKKTNELYDLESFKQGEKILVGKLVKEGNQYKVVI